MSQPPKSPETVPSALDNPDLVRLAECLERSQRLLLGLSWYADIRHWYAPQLDGREIPGRSNAAVPLSARPGAVDRDGVLEADGGDRARLALSEELGDRLAVDLWLRPLAAEQAAGSLLRYADRFQPQNSHFAFAVAQGLRGLAAEEAALAPGNALTLHALEILPMLAAAEDEQRIFAEALTFYAEPASWFATRPDGSAVPAAQLGRGMADFTTPGRRNGPTGIFVPDLGGTARGAIEAARAALFSPSLTRFHDAIQNAAADRLLDEAAQVDGRLSLNGRTIRAQLLERAAALAPPAPLGRTPSPTRILPPPRLRL